MTELIMREQKADYEHYAELLARRDILTREADSYMDLYIHEFGQELTALFSEKVECIRLKKCIAFAQQAANHGRKADPSAMRLAVESEMTAYYQQLSEMAQDNERCREIRFAPENTVRQVKKIYRDLAKQLHPDLNPETEKNPKLQELWNRIGAAYRAYDLKEMRELQVLAAEALRSLGMEAQEIEIPDVQTRIEELEKEIHEITEKDPYRFRFLLEDDQAVQEKHKEIAEELAQWQDGRRQLEEMLNELLGGIAWQMN